MTADQAIEIINNAHQYSQEAYDEAVASVEEAFKKAGGFELLARGIVEAHNPDSKHHWHGTGDYEGQSEFRTEDFIDELTGIIQRIETDEEEVK